MPPKRKETAEAAGDAVEPRRSGRDRKGAQPVYNDDEDNEGAKPRTKKQKANDSKNQEEAPSDEPKAAAKNGDADKEGEGEDTPATSAILKVGDSVPLDLSLVTDEGKDVTMKDLVGEKGLVILLYPKANTPGCTTQAIAFNENHSAFTSAGFNVYGLSMDGPKSLTNWKAKHSFQYTLLSDPKQALIKILGGAKGKGITRSHFVIDNNGKILLASIGVKPKESTEAAKAFVEAL